MGAGVIPLRNFVEVSWKDAHTSAACLACQTPFPDPPDRQPGGEDTTIKAPEVKGVSESGRYACSLCGCHFCIDCDVFCHETVHNCPGCEAGLKGPGKGRSKGENGVEANGHANGAMVID